MAAGLSWCEKSSFLGAASHKCPHRTWHRHLKKAMQTILFHKYPGTKHYNAKGPQNTGPTLQLGRHGTPTIHVHYFSSHSLLFFMISSLYTGECSRSRFAWRKNQKYQRLRDWLSLRDCRPWIMEDAARCKSLMMTLRLACSTLSAASASVHQTHSQDLLRWCLDVFETVWCFVVFPTHGFIASSLRMKSPRLAWPLAATVAASPRTVRVPL